MTLKVLVCALALLASPAAVVAGANTERPNVVALEAGGRGLLFSVQYERWLNDWVSLGGGLSGFPCVECTVDGGFRGYLMLLVPTWASLAVPLGDVHSLVLSAGATVGLPLASGGRSFAYPNIGLAYQLHLHGGFVLRPGFLLILVFPENGTAYIQPWGGLQVGFSF